jgi:hypothetical protein
MNEDFNRQPCVENSRFLINAQNIIVHRYEVLGTRLR